MQGIRVDKYQTRVIFQALAHKSADCCVMVLSVFSSTPRPRHRLPVGLASPPPAKTPLLQPR